MRQLKNIPASIYQRLLNYSRTKKIVFHEVLQYYAIERLLYRLSVSPYRDIFILKGGLSFLTFDVDFPWPNFRGPLPSLNY
jgi:hypothetical protein